MTGSAIEDSHSGITKPAAIIVEAIQGEGGTIVPPPGWLQVIAAYARENDVPLICDEIQSGLGRTGRWFAFEHEGIVPDMILMSKALGGIGLPISVVVYHERLDRWGPGAHAGTFRGNQMAMAAGTAALEFMQAHRLVEHAARLGAVLMRTFRSAFGRSPIISDIRGRGLMIGIECVSPQVARLLQATCLSHGLLIELGGRGGRVLRLLPPLVITDAHAEAIFRILERAVETVENIVTDT